MGHQENMFERLPDALVLEIFACLPLITQQEQVAQCCRRFKSLARQIAILHIESNSKDPSFEDAVTAKILGRVKNTLRALRVTADEVCFKEESISAWLGSCSASLEFLQIEDDLGDDFKTADLNSRLKFASTCPSLESLHLNGSCKIPLLPAAITTTRGPLFKRLEELTLMRLCIPTNDLLQGLVANCPALRKLHLPSLGGFKSIRIERAVLEDFLVSGVEGWMSGAGNKPAKFDFVRSKTAHLEHCTCEPTPCHSSIAAATFSSFPYSFLQDGDFGPFNPQAARD